MPRLMRNTDATYFAAYFNDILVGHSALVRENGKWILEGLRVRPEFREKGIGKKLTEIRVNCAISQKAKSVWYLARDKNLVSICCHMKLGFQKHCGDKPDCKITDVVWYKLDLTPEFIESFSKKNLQKV